jgi:hypothetical protein
MASIVVSDLRPAGSALFLDSETYMNDIVDDELNGVNGGISFPSSIYPIVVATRASSGYCVRGVSALTGVSAYFKFR